MRASAAAVLESISGDNVILEKVSADVSINDLLAEVTVTQKYRNPGESNIEALYTFPMPLDGILLSFDVEIGDRKLSGTVVEKSDAERRYEDAVTDGDTAILLEQVEPGLYSASVGNLLPGETAVLRFRYGQFLRWNGERVRLMIPTTVAPRYGDASAAGLAPHQTPEYSFDAERSFNMHVSAKGLLKNANFSSPSHEIRVFSKARETKINFVGNPGMDRDFVLEAFAPNCNANCALVAADIDGWVALASFRPEIDEEQEREFRSIKIVIDCSGSMAGDSIAQAREGLERILDGLGDGDHFDIVAFGSTHRALFGRETPVSGRTRDRARRFVRELDADMGGTEIGEALSAAYETPEETGLSRDLLLITDGAVWNNEEIFSRAGRSGHRIFTVGVGSAVAEPFARELAEVTGGACELVAPNEDMAERIHRHFQRMYAPLARNVSIKWPDPELRSTPTSIETVYGGDTLHVFAWFAERPKGTVSLDFTLSSGVSVMHEAKLHPIENDPDAIGAANRSPTSLARIGATRRIAMTDDTEVAVDMAVKYQILSRWTNYIVIHERADNEKAEDLPTIHKVPQVLAAGSHGNGTVMAQSLAPSVRRVVDSTGGHASFSPGRMRPLLSMSAGIDHSDKVILEIEPGPQRNLLENFSADISAARFVQLLNSRSIPPSPTLEYFEHWGLPETILESLQELLEAGEIEEEVVSTFLYVLSQSEAGRKIKRPIRRQILKAYKSLRPRRAVLETVSPIYYGWQDPKIT
jgi:Ca-activated chloride channel homolog